MSAGEETTTRKTTKVSLENVIKGLSSGFEKTGVPVFNTGDSVRVHAKIIEGTKERVQVFEGVVIKRSKGSKADATFTVRKISYNVGVERTFPVHSPRVEKIEVVSRAKVRRARLFYLRPLRGKATRMKTIFETNRGENTATKQDSTEVA